MRARAAVQIQGITQVSENGTHFDAIRRWVIRHRLTSWQREGEDRLQLAQEWLESGENYQSLGDVVEGWVLGNGEWISREDMWERLTSAQVARIRKEGRDYVDAEDLWGEGDTLTP